MLSNRQTINIETIKYKTNKIMKKIKLFMMLALLVMGVSNSWGYTYRVLFESGAVQGGYTVNANQDVVTSGDDALVLVSSQPLSSSNIGRYITARTVDKNTAGFQIATVADAKQMGVKVNGSTVTFDGVIFITYNYDGSGTPYNESDENFYYSNIYTAINGRNYGSSESNTNPKVVSQIYLGDKKVAISLKNTALQNATIPVAYDGRTVVAIQREGMVYTGSYKPDLYNCDDRYTNSNYHDTPTNRNSTYYDERYTSDPANLFTYGKINNNLKTVTFADNSQVASIGDYAFACCLNLTEVNNIPSSLAFLGQAAFSCCRKLTTVDFPTRSKLKSLRNYTFWYCTSINRLALPEGLVEIEGMSSGAAMQYMTSLEDLHLPNTLKRVGPHFLCCATSLKTLTIPVSVEYIDGAFLHGCESLETCYILGPAATLVSGGNDNPFSPNYTLCCDPVNNCTFYTTSDNLQDYQNPNSAWSSIDNDGNWTLGNWYTDPEYANYLTTIPAETRTFPNKWVTAVFPTNPDREILKSEFGEGTKLAQMTECTGYTVQEIQGKKYRVYHLNFTELAAGDDAAIPEGVPLLIKAGDETKSFIVYETADQDADWFKIHATTPHEVTVECSQDGANIIMKGQYIGHNIQPGEIYFKNNDSEIVNGVEHPKFLMAPKTGYVTIDPCRCWWTIEDGDHISQSGTMGAKAAGLFGDDEATGIDELPTRVVIDAIYDLNGRKLNVKPEELPQGMYIINGKKVLNK